MTRRPYIDTQAAIYTVVQKTIFFFFFGGAGAPLNRLGKESKTNKELGPWEAGRYFVDINQSARRIGLDESYYLLHNLQSGYCQGVKGEL
jgi:hypothetical protein